MTADSDDLHDSTPKPGPKPAADYEVGYGRPPKSGQFRPGKSGNPEGRRRKPLTVSENLAQILNERVQVMEGGQPRKLSKLTIILKALVNKAAKGDTGALRAILDIQRSHEGSTSATLEPLLLDEDSQKIIEMFLQQQGIEGNVSVADGGSSPRTESSVDNTFLPGGDTSETPS